MKKIVIISNRGRGDSGLVEFIRAVFPECDICTESADMEGFESNKKPCRFDRRITNETKFEIRRRLWQKS